MKDFLFTLREAELLNEKQLIKALNELERKESIPHFHQAPLLDMLSLVQVDSTLQHIDQLLQAKEVEIKQAALAWEAGTLTRKQARIKIARLVVQKNQIFQKQQIQHDRIQSIIERLRQIIDQPTFEFPEYLRSLANSPIQSTSTDFVRAFKDSWKKWTNLIKGEQARVELGIEESFDKIEQDILSKLLPSKANDSVKTFDLGQILPSFDSDVQEEILFRTPPQPAPDSAGPEPVAPVTPPPVQSSPWDVVGHIIYDDNQAPLGVIRPPIKVEEGTYLPVVTEEALTLTVLKQRYREVLKQTNLLSASVQQITETIGAALGIPEKLVLQPSFFNQWLEKIGSEVSPMKPNLTKVVFLPVPSIDYTITPLTIPKDQLVQLRVPAWIPAPGSDQVTDFPTIQGQPIKGMGGSLFGRVQGMLPSSPFGQAFIIRREVPPSFLLTNFLEGLGKQNLAELRFYIAKELNVGEGEVFTAENLWHQNNKERLLISPHEIAAAYFAVLPTSAFTFNNHVIRAKTGVYFHTVPETFRYLVGQSLTMGDEKGLIYGFTVSGDRFDLLWSPKDPVEIIKEVGRRSSDQYVNRFKQRISMALGTSYQESLWPSNLARYFLNFIWMEERLSLADAMALIENRFTLRRTPFTSIESLSPEGAQCKP